MACDSSDSGIGGYESSSQVDGSIQYPIIELYVLQGDFVLGGEMSYADLALVDAEPWLERTIPDVKLPEKLKAVVTKVEADPKISTYLASRPKTAF